MILQDKNCLIFGGSAGIPLTIADRISEAGGKTCLVVPSSDQMDTDISEAKIRKTIVHNYLDADNLALLFTQHLNDLAPFDALVFAGGIGGTRPLKLTKPDFVRQMFEANVFSFMEIMRLASKKGILADGASAIAVSSISSTKGLKAKSAYAASKAALEGAVRSFAAELSSRKIRVNAIQKGWVSADMNLSFIQDNMSLSENSDLAKQVLGVIEPEEIANLVCFLISDQVKTITGTSILIDGGYSL